MVGNMYYACIQARKKLQYIYLNIRSMNIESRPMFHQVPGRGSVGGGRHSWGCVEALPNFGEVQRGWGMLRSLA